MAAVATAGGSHRVRFSRRQYPVTTTTLSSCFVVVIVVLATMLAPLQVHGQRAILNWNKKLWNRAGRGGSSPTTIKGEPQPAKQNHNSNNKNNNDKSIKMDPTITPTATRTTTASTINLWYWITLTGLVLGLLHLADDGKALDENGNENDWKEETMDATPSQDDEFIVHDGGDHKIGLHDIDLSFENIKLTLESKKGTRLLLDGSPRGRARPGRMLAIMGPSGAGKSTLLHALAGRIKDSSKLTLEGSRYINGHPVDGDSMLPSAFIQQEAVFFPHMTVRETLNFRVELKLGRMAASKTKRDKVVNDLMEQVGLTKSADTIVGDNKVRGISGGERKRLSIAVEMISSPNLVFLDEPTSGLDSTAATTLIATLRKLADQGRTVVAVIHQPSQHVFSKFDDLLLISEGRQMYFGELKDVRSHMEKLGFPAEPEIGTAEHVLDCISRQPIEDETDEEAAARVEKIALAAADAQPDLGITEEQKIHGVLSSIDKRSRPKSGLLTQFKLLFQRSFREVIRGKTAIVVKLVQQVTVAVIYGGIYGLGNNQASIQDRFGLMSLIAIGAANMAVAAAIRAFPKEKAIVSAELASRMYNTLPYFIAKALSELPLVGIFNTLFGIIVYRLTGMSRMKGKFGKFLGLLSTHGLASEATGLLVGAISPNSDVALAIFPAILVLNIIFDGKNISEENTPWLLRWIPKVGLIRWGFEGLCVNEFDGLVFDTSGPRRGPVAKTGADALARFGLGSKSLGDVVRAQGAITLFCWLMSYLGLSLTRDRFLLMNTPKTSNKKTKQAI